MSLGVVDVERDVVLSLDAGTALVIDPDVLSLKAQLEEFTLGDGNFHTSMSAGHFGLKDLIICNQIPNSIMWKESVTSENSNVVMIKVIIQSSTNNYLQCLWVTLDNRIGLLRSPARRSCLCRSLLHMGHRSILLKTHQCKMLAVTLGANIILRTMNYTSLNTRFSISEKCFD